MLDMVTRHTIQTLRGANHTIVDVAKHTGVSVSTVKRVAGEAAVGNFDDAAERKGRGIGRPSKVEQWRGVVEQLVKERDSDGRPLQSKEILRRLRAKGLKCGKSAVYAFVAGLRDDVNDDFITRFEGLPGEFCQHDFGQVRVRFADGYPYGEHRQAPEPPSCASSPACARCPRPSKSRRLSRSCTSAVSRVLFQCSGASSRARRWSQAGRIVSRSRR